MKLAVTFYSGNPDGIPDGWPKSSTLVGDTYAAQPGETVMTIQELADYRAQLQPSYDTWKAGNDTAQAATVAAAKDAALRTDAKARMIELTSTPLALRATISVLIDEINTLRNELNKAKANITTWRAEPALNLRTLAQAKNAISNAIDNRTAD
jgi:hypothetical protein